MIGSVRREETEFGSLMKQPDELGGSQTQSTYAVAADADCAYTRVKAGGAKIAMEIRGGNYGGRGSVALMLKVIRGALAATTRGHIL